MRSSHLRSTDVSYRGLHMFTRSFFASALAVALFAVGGCGVISTHTKLGSTPKLPSGSTSRAVLSGQAVRIDAPLSNDFVAIALWFHGQGGDADTRMNQSWLNILREHGWAVASGDLGGNSWGNSTAVRAARDLQRWATLITGKPVKLIVAGSMGAATSLNAIIRGQIRAPCWYGTMPVFDIRSLALVPEFGAQLRAAFPGGIPPEYNPPDGNLPPGIYRVVSSDADTKVPAQSNADQLAARTAASVLKVSGEHGDPSHFNSGDLEKFASKCLTANPSSGK